MSYLIGQGLSGLIPSIVAIIQGIDQLLIVINYWNQYFCFLKELVEVLSASTQPLLLLTNQKYFPFIQSHDFLWEYFLYFWW